MIFLSILLILTYHHHQTVFCLSRLKKQLDIDHLHIQIIGKLIWLNECNGSKEGLVSWNKGEKFASLGIGHFTWYPQHSSCFSKETFPSLLLFLKKQGIIIPKWLDQVRHCPWKDRNEFLQAQKTPFMSMLREWLYQHSSTQALFIVKNFQKIFPIVITKLPSKQRDKVLKQFYRLSHLPAGLYALIDYYHFKGIGSAEGKLHQDKSWGLLQVLEQMQGADFTEKAIQDFIIAAKLVLDRRINQSHHKELEKKWRAGWFNRLDRYQSYAMRVAAL